MYALKHLCYFIPAFAILALTTPAQANAADANSYRAGNPYLKTMAHSPNQCAVQCTGDAQCRGWNFVVPNAHVQSGICEFNARAVAPVYSSVSVSGENLTAIDPVMSGVVSGGTRTIRVGSPQASIAPIKRTQTAGSKRIIKRRAVPGANPAVTPTSLKQPVNNRTPRIYGQTKATAPMHQNEQQRGAAPLKKPQDTRLQQTRPAQAQPQQARPQIMSREQAFYREQYLQAQEAQRQQDLNMQRQAQYQNIPQPPYPPNAQPMRPITAPHAPLPFNTPSMPMPPANIPPSTGQNPSLFGSLHDDLTQMTAVPRPQVAPDNLANPDAPISTVPAVPTKPVNTQGLQTEAIPNLAGG